MTFKAVKRIFSHKQKISAPPEIIFPLFCPVRNYEWIPDWESELIYSKSGFAEPGCIFKTFDPYEGEDLWVTYKYQPYSSLFFMRINQFRTMKYKIYFSSTSKTESELIWRQEIVSVNSKGSEFVADLEKQDFMDMVDMLEKLLNNYINYFHIKLKQADHK